MHVLRPYINWLFLGLSLSLVFPIEYWHECSFDEDLDGIVHDWAEENLEEQHPECELCDLTFAPYAELESSHSSSFFPLFEQSISHSGPLIENSAPLFHPLRGPPALV